METPPSLTRMLFVSKGSKGDAGLSPGQAPPGETVGPLSPPDSYTDMTSLTPSLLSSLLYLASSTCRPFHEFSSCLSSEHPPCLCCHISLASSRLPPLPLLTPPTTSIFQPHPQYLPTYIQYKCKTQIDLLSMQLIIWYFHQIFDLKWSWIQKHYEYKCKQATVTLPQSWLLTNEGLALNIEANRGFARCLLLGASS